MNASLLKLCETVKSAGGRAMLVGGCVRDRLLGIDSKDLDVEVFGIDATTLRNTLTQIGRVNKVGEQFAVYKVIIDEEEAGRTEIDVSLPRRESKSGRGHRGFLVEGDPDMSFEEAARRRDFTINAIMLDPLLDEIVDPFGGREDLQARTLKAVCSDTFVEDSLRVLRAVQLAARFELTIDEDTVHLCRGIDLSDLPKERIWGEIEKLLIMAPRPSIGFRQARELKVLEKLFPELKSLTSFDARHAGENAFDHTCKTLDVTADMSLQLNKPVRLTVMLAALCHSLEQSSEGLEKTRSVLNALGIQTVSGFDVRSRVLAIIQHLGVPRRFYENSERTTDGDIRRLSRLVEPDLLYRTSRACAMAGSNSSDAAAEDWFIERARSLGVQHSPPSPLLLGRHLIEAGIQPGPQMGEMLRLAYEKQLDGEVTTVEQALAAALEGH